MRSKTLAIAAVVLVAAAAALLLLGSSEAERADRAAAPARAAREAPAPPEVLFVRRRGGVPALWAARLRRIRGVSAVGRTGRTQALLVRSTRAGGAAVDRAPAGHAIPLDALVVQPRRHAKALGREELRRLGPGRVLLSRTSGRLRRVGPGARLTLTGGRTLRVAGVVDDEAVLTAELVMHPSDAGADPFENGQLVVAAKDPRRVVAALPSDDATRVRLLSQRRDRSRGGIARPAELKARFGEFAVRLPYGSDWIDIDPGWVRRNVVTRPVPILGNVTCNRRLIGPLRRALREFERRRLSALVDRGDYAGCYAPRRIPGSGSLSLHAWGLAIDLNAAANPRLGRSRHDRRLVAAFERAGFTWGGRWPTAPDPMHFELQAPARRD